MGYIITCGCGDTNQFAKDAFRLLFKGQPIPPVINPEALPSELSLLSPQVEAADRSGEKFAFYADGEELWDLMKGVRLA